MTETWRTRRFQLVVVAPRMRGGEEVGRPHHGGERHQVDHLDDPRRGEIDGDLGGADEEGQHQHVGEGREIGAAMQEGEGRGAAQPLPRPVGGGPGRHGAAKAADDRPRLIDRRKEKRRRQAQECVDGARLGPERDGADHEGEQEPVTHDVDRQERRDDPAIGPADALQRRLDAGEGDGKRHQHDRQEIHAFDPAAGEGHGDEDERGERGGSACRDEQREAQKAPELVVLAALPEHRNVAYRRVAEAQRADRGKHGEPHPGIGEDAILELPISRARTICAKKARPAFPSRIASASAPARRATATSSRAARSS